MKFILSLAMLLELSSFSSMAHGDNSYKVIFETMDCNGNSGFATVGLDEIYKVTNGDCSDPNNPGKKLKKLLVHDGTGSYRVFSLSQDEAKNVILDVREYMKSRKEVP